MELKVVCCVCQTVIRDGDESKPVSHSYCRTCAAAQLRQLDIWDADRAAEYEEAFENRLGTMLAKKMEREGASCLS